MNDLETQIAKIQIGNAKQANTFVFVMADRIDQTDTELYVICELPLFNPAAAADCEHIAQAIAASLQRSFRKQVDETSFENSLTTINEELGKLAGLGKTNWIGKLNALIGARHGNALSIAASGKITALLLRDGQFTTVAETSAPTHALKTFENFAVGKLRLHDILILSTSQLFSYVSADRLKNVLQQYTLPLAGQEIIGILENNAGPEVAFGALIAQMAEPGTVMEEEIEPLQTRTERSPQQRAQALVSKSGSAAASALGKGLSGARNIFKKETAAKVKSLFSKQNKALEIMGQGFYSAKNKLSKDQFQQLSKQKKFFFISAGVLLLALVVNIILAHRYSKAKTITVNQATNISAIQKLLSNANAAYLYNDDSDATNLLTQLEKARNSLGALSGSEKQEVAAIDQQVTALQQKIEHLEPVQPVTVAALTPADNLITLPGYLATQTNGALVSYNRTTGNTEDGILRASKTIAGSTFLKGNDAMIYTGTSLAVWNFSTGLFSPEYTNGVPAQAAFGGLRTYPTNNRAYVMDKQAGTITSYAWDEKTGISKPVLSVSGQDFSQAMDFAIDSSIYVLSPKGITKFEGGKLVPFNFPALQTPLSTTGKIYTEKGFANIYILDSGNNRILILDKTGNLVNILTSDQFNHLKDFAVDEANKTIWVLNDTTLLKANF